MHSSPEEEDELKKLIHSTTHNIIESDKNELLELLAELEEEVTEDLNDDVFQLEKLIDAFLTGDYLEGKPLLPMIGETRWFLNNPKIETTALKNVDRWCQKQSISCSFYIHTVK